MSTIVAKYDGRAHEIRTRVVVMPAIGGLASVPAAVKCVAVWDTGSNNSVIDAGVARKLGLTPISMTTVLTANGPYETPVYAIDLVLPSDETLADILVTESNLQVCDALIGMDVITLGDFLITNAPDTRFEFRIPSQGSVTLQ